MGDGGRMTDRFPWALHYIILEVRENVHGGVRHQGRYMKFWILTYLSVYSS